MNDTQITVVGRLVGAPVLRDTVSGTPMATFRIATNSRRPKAGAPGEFEDGPTSFYNVRAFRQLAANAVASLAKGEAVLVHGVVEVGEYDRPDGTKGTSVDIVARSLGHDLTWGVSYFRKVVRGRAADGAAEPPAHPLRASMEAMATVMGESMSAPSASAPALSGGVRVDEETGEVLEARSPAA